MLPVGPDRIARQMESAHLVGVQRISCRESKPGRQYNFWGTIAVTEVTDFEASLLVQSHASHEALPYWPR
jgi:hypothetical protein